MDNCSPSGEGMGAAKKGTEWMGGLVVVYGAEC